MGRKALALGALALSLMLSACTSGGSEAEETPTPEQSTAPAPESLPGQGQVPRADGEYAPASVEELDDDPATAARQFVLSFYGWDSREWDTEYPTGREMVGEETTALMTESLDSTFDSDGIIPYGVPMEFDPSEFASESDYVETIDVTAYADDHHLTDTFGIWNVDIVLNIVPGQAQEEGITRSETLNLPVVVTLARESADDPWLADDVNVARSW